MDNFETSEDRLKKMGIILPAPVKTPPDMRLPFAFVRVRPMRALIAGHVGINPDGSIAGPFGKVGAEVTPEEAYQYARLAGLAVLSSLKKELGSLNRITAWLRVFGMVNAAPGFTQLPQVINGFSDLIITVFGPHIGQHSRSAIGVAELPFNAPVEVEAEVEIG